jgi:hypothetical protein
MFRRLVIRLNNGIVRRRRIRVPPENLLLLLPHCLQRSLCLQKITADLNSCRGCGECNMAALLKLRDEFHVQCRVASGGRQAADLTRSRDVRAIVACACDKELFEGIRAAFPKPVLAVRNETPHGPCHDTTVNVDLVRAALVEMLGRE